MILTEKQKLFVFDKLFCEWDESPSLNLDWIVEREELAENCDVYTGKCIFPYSIRIDGWDWEYITPELYQEIIKR